MALRLVEAAAAFPGGQLHIPASGRHRPGAAGHRGRTATDVAARLQGDIACGLDCGAHVLARDAAQVRHVTCTDVHHAPPGQRAGVHQAT
ncbi:hypothetical protein RV045_12110 [Comamonadaceae bacterium SL12-8]|uniref:Uncharacterized protein n=1 Tax=Amphibiibacter pelophylacis TaxID=1799477 RepID=A0ACC6P4M5_9BURK